MSLASQTSTRSWARGLTLGALLVLGGGLAADEPPTAPPAPPAPTEPSAYGATPGELVPYAGGGEPDRRFFQTPPTFRGPTEDIALAPGTPLRLGAFTPLAGLDAAVGRRMHNGYVLALEEANAAGGFRPGSPYELVTKNENDTWGAAGNALVDMLEQDHILAFLGGLEDANSHVLTRLILKLEIAMVNTGGTDPTLTEHNIPWVLRLRPDDRQGCYRLARRIFEEDRHERVAVLRSNDRYGRVGIRELVDAARRLHHPILTEMRFTAVETDFTRQIEVLRSVQPDAIVLWGRAAPSGRALKALRAAGLDVPIYGPDRLVDRDFLAAAGATAEGVVAFHPFDPGRADPAWTGFQERYRVRFHEPPDAQAAYAYDGMRYLLEALGRSGVNRGRLIHELFAPTTYAGVTGTVRFDATHNNVAPVVLGKVVDGAWRFGP